MLQRVLNKEGNLYTCSLLEEIHEQVFEVVDFSTDNIDILINNILNIEQDYYNFEFSDEIIEVETSLIKMELKDTLNDDETEKYFELKLRLDELHTITGFMMRKFMIDSN